jgi:hypothetical protein
MSYWIKLIDILIYYVDKNYQNKLLNWINWYIDLLSW